MTDAQRQVLTKHLAEMNKRGRPQVRSARDMVNAVLYVQATGCQTTGCQSFSSIILMTSCGPAMIKISSTAARNCDGGKNKSDRILRPPRHKHGGENKNEKTMMARPFKNAPITRAILGHPDHRRNDEASLTSSALD